MDTFVDPVKRDYVLANGAPVRDPAAGLANAVYVRLVTPLGSWWQDVLLGSRLHELRREKDVSRVSQKAWRYATNALKPILADGRATKIEVSTEQPHNGWLNLLVEVTAASGEVFTFKHPVKVS